MSEFKDLHKFFGQHQPPPLPPQPPPPQLPQPPPQHPQHHQRGAANHGSFTGAGSNSLTNFFPESEPFPDNDFRSFSDLLAGALATPLPGTGELNLGLDNYSWGADHRAEKSNRNNNNNGNNNSNNNGNNNDANNNDVNANNGVGFKQNRPGSLVLPPVAPVFNVSPGFSPSAFLTSPTFLSPLGMSPQQTLAHITAQAAHSALSHQAHLTNIQPADTPNNNNNNNPPSFPSTTTAAPPPYQPPIFNTGHHQHGRAPQHSFPAAVDKPADDGYNWRKYGQKQVKGSEYPRSYYRCTTPNCPVKKKVERSYDGHITEIIYKGQHNHGRPQNGRRGNKDTNNTGCLLGGDSLWPGGANNNNNNNNVQYDSAQATSMQLHGPSDSEESAENSQHLLDDGDGDDEDDDDDDDDDDYNDQPRAKRRKGGGGVREGGYTHRTMTEPKIVVQTRSDVDLLDDGYRWRKYGQKVVKGNPNPRSYYKCTTAGCKVRKHVERASTDASAVITTYEGKHNHDVPATRGGSSNNNNNNNNNFQPTQMKLHNNSAVAQMSFGNNNNNNDQRPMTLRLKEEQLVL